jgi:hypothetical protein
MSESETTILRKAKEGVGKHANAAYNGLSAAAIVWLFVTFASKDDVNRFIDQTNLERSKVWQKVMDQEVELQLLKRRFSGLDGTNAPGVAFNP